MIYKLTKKVKKNTEVIWLEINGSLLKKKEREIRETVFISIYKKLW